MCNSRILKIIYGDFVKYQALIQSTTTISLPSHTELSHSRIYEQWIKKQRSSAVESKIQGGVRTKLTRFILTSLSVMNYTGCTDAYFRRVYSRYAYDISRKRFAFRVEHEINYRVSRVPDIYLALNGDRRVYPRAYVTQNGRKSEMETWSRCLRW